MIVERKEIHGQRRRKRLPFAGLHLGEPATHERHSAQELNVEMPHADRTPGRFANQVERIGSERARRL